MSLWESLRIAWEALGTNKLRSVLTMLGIIIGVGSVIAIFAIGRGTGAAVKGELQGATTGQIILMPGAMGPGSERARTEPFTDQDLKNLERLLPDVAAVTTSFTMPQALVKHQRDTLMGTVVGETYNFADAFGIEIAQGRWLKREEDEQGARVAVLGDGAARRLMGENGRPVGKSITINGSSFRVVGVTRQTSGMLASMGAEDTSIYVPVTWVRRVMGDPPILMVMVKAKAGADTQQVLDDALALLQRTHRGAAFSGQTLDVLVGAVTKVLSVITGVLSAVAAISLVVGGVGIMNIMLVSVTERTREIGIRKALGASYRDILLQFLIEAILLSLIGGLIGVGLASIPVWLVGRWLKISLLMDWLSISLALGFSVGVGVLFGVYPASKAARMDPIEALRFE